VNAVLSSLRQPRYAALSALMLLIAIVCVLLGTWQIARLAQKHGANDELRHNDHAAPTPVTSVLPITGSAPRPKADAVQYRLITATGTYDAADQGLVRQRTVDGDTGYLVLTPLRTDGATLLVVRGFVSATTSETVAAPAPPTGKVTITARVEPAETRSDKAAELPRGQLESINPIDQAQRLGTPVLDGYAELIAGQRGTAGLVTIPAPDLSNPAGGAVEPQHLAYIIQWYLFAALALAAPFAMVRADSRAERNTASRDIDEEPVEPTPLDQRAARLADRYGRTAR